MNQSQFLELVFGERDGFVAAAFGREPYREDTGKYRHREWREVRYAWPSDRDRFVKESTQELATGEPVDIYVCPALRLTDARNGSGGPKGTNATPPRILWADCDDVPDLGLLAKLDALIVESGQPGHRHVYVPLQHAVPVVVHRALNKALAAYLSADAKWNDGSLLRLPGTMNFKPTVPVAGDPEPAQPVRVIKAQAKAWAIEDIAELLRVDITAANTNKVKTSTPVTHAQPAPHPLPARVQAALDNPDITDRSRAHARVVGACLDAGLSIGQATSVCANYPPSTEKYGDRLPDEVARFWDKARSERESRSTTNTHVTDTDEPLTVVPFPVLDQAALKGKVGQIVETVAPHTEAHPAAILIQLLARIGAAVGNGPHMLIGNREHPARINPLIVGKTSDGAKGTSHEVVSALFSDRHRPGGLLSLIRNPLRVLSGLSSGEGLIELVRDPNGDDPDAKNFDEGVEDKRLLVVEGEFAGVLAMMDRQGSILPRVVREAWDGDILRTLSRHSPLAATGAHIVIVGHVTPGELRIKLKEAQVVGGTLNRFIPTASRRTKFLPAGGNLPDDVLDEFAPQVAAIVERGRLRLRYERTDAADKLWTDSYPRLRRARPDGPVAQIVARAAPQVSRLSLAYAIADSSRAIEEQHLASALALWRYAEDTAEWMHGAHVDSAEIDSLVGFIAAGGPAGRTRTQISSEHFNRNKDKAFIDATLSELLRDGRIRQETDPTRPGRPVTRYRTC